MTNNSPRERYETDRADAYAGFLEDIVKALELPKDFQWDDIASEVRKLKTLSKNPWIKDATQWMNESLRMKDETERLQKEIDAYRARLFDLGHNDLDY